MNNRIMKHTAAAVATLAMALLPASAMADDGRVTYTANVSGDVSFLGTSKKENYDVAVRLIGKDLRGLKIESISVPFKGTTDNTANATVWITRKLALKSKKNTPDGPTATATVDGSTLTGTFSEPFTIDTDTLYLGYSFEVTDLVATTKQPVALTYDDGDCGIYVHTSRTYMNWKDRSAAWGCSALSATLCGVADNGAAFDAPNVSYGQTNMPTKVKMTLRNKGVAGVSSIDYTYTQGTQKGTGHLTLTTPIAGIYNAGQTVTLSLDAMAQSGNYPLAVTINKVNGVEQTPTTAEGNVLVYNKLPKHSSVMEEYTGTWCAWCPRGFTAIEIMNHKHPYDFIALSYHNADAMTVMESSQFPSSVSGFPSACIDRRSGMVDPMYGNANSGLGIEKVWQSCVDLLAPADIEPVAAYDADATTITAKAKIYFPVDRTDADRYKLEFVLVGDSLHGEGDNWAQSNKYTSSDASQLLYPTYKEGEVFLQGNSSIEGLYFNDVVLGTTRLTSGLASLPANVLESVTEEVTGTFNVADITVDHDPSLLYVVVLLIDNNNGGAIVNAAKAYVQTAAGISDVNKQSGKADRAEAYYDLQGRRISKPAHGMHIVRMASGRTVKVAK